MFLVPPPAGLDGVPLSKAYKPYVVEGGRPITQSKKFYLEDYIQIWVDVTGASMPARSLGRIKHR